MQVGCVKIGHFRREMRYNSKMVQDRCIVSVKVEQEVTCALSNGVVSGDPNPPNHPFFSIFRRLSHLCTG